MHTHISMTQSDKLQDMMSLHRLENRLNEDLSGNINAVNDVNQLPANLNLTKGEDKD